MIPNQLRRNHCNNGQHMHKHKKNFGFLARSQPTICNIISSGDTNFIFPYFEKLFVWKFIVFQSGKNGMRVWQKSFESINKNTNKPFRLKSHLKREFRNDHVHLSNGEKKYTNSLGKIGLNCSFALLTKQFKCAKSLLSFDNFS